MGGWGKKLSSGGSGRGVLKRFSNWFVSAARMRNCVRTWSGRLSSCYGAPQVSFSSLVKVIASINGMRHSLPKQICGISHARRVEALIKIQYFVFSSLFETFSLDCDE